MEDINLILMRIMIIKKNHIFNTIPYSIYLFIIECIQIFLTAGIILIKGKFLDETLSYVIIKSSIK